jgi:hypothetical protein
MRLASGSAPQAVATPRLTRLDSGEHVLDRVLQGMPVSSAGVRTVQSGALSLSLSSKTTSSPLSKSERWQVVPSPGN